MNTSRIATISITFCYCGDSSLEYASRIATVFNSRGLQPTGKQPRKSSRVATILWIDIEHICAMANTFNQNYQHFIFSTKNRESLISSELELDLFKYMGGIANSLKCKLLCAGGMANHVHLLASLHSMVSTASFLQDLKGSSSKWINDNRLTSKAFAWQDGAANFSVSGYSLEKTKVYIQNQKEHHANASFEEEYRKVLLAHNVVIDENYLFG